MNSQEALVQIEALEAALLEEQAGREALELELQDLRARNAKAQAEIQAFKNDIWSIEEVQQALDAVSRTGSEFVIHMDHRLRTTLSGLLGMIELLMNCELTDDEHEFVVGAQNSGQELLRILNDILDYCRMDAGHIEVCQETVDGATFLDELVGPMEGLAEGFGTKIETSVGEELPRQLWLDREHLGRALGHLVGNALRHSSGSTVRVEAGTQGRGSDATIVVSVIDEGPGIAPEDLTRVVEAFERLNEDDHEGVGLGLTIVRRLAELMGGRFELSSIVGEGTTASLIFPYAAVTEEISEPEVDDDQAAHDVARVLVVEDNDVNQKVALGFLKMIGCESEVAMNGLEAIEALSRGEIDLVLMDCMMPEVDGYEATRRIRGGAAGEEQAKIPIIALTADDSTGARQNCLRAGMDDYMAKPVRIDRLRAMLRIWLPPNLRPSAQ